MTSLLLRAWLVVLVVAAAAGTADARQKRKGKGKRKTKARPVAAEVLRVAPDIAGQDVDGTPYALSNVLQRGAKAVVVSFLDPEDLDNKRAINDLAKLRSEWSPFGVELVQVGYATETPALHDFARKNTLAWPVIADPDDAIARAYGVEHPHHLALVNAEQRVAYQSTEYAPERYDVLRKEIARVLERAPPWGEQGRSAMLAYSHKLVFGRPPSAPGASVRWQPLAMLVGKAAGAYISMQGAETYEQYEAHLAQGEYDIVDATPLIASTVLDRYVPVATLQRRNKNTYRGILFALKSSGLRDVASLRGKTVGLVSPQSASGGVFPFAELLQAGLEPEVNVRLMWLGSHPDVAKAVASGKVDAGACYDDCRELAWPEPKVMDAQTTILGLTDEIPSEVILVRRSMSADMREAIARALESIEAQQVLLSLITAGEEPITGVGEPSESAIRAAAKTLGGVPEAIEKAQRRAAERARREAGGGG